MSTRNARPGRCRSATLGPRGLQPRCTASHRTPHRSRRAAQDRACGRDWRYLCCCRYWLGVLKRRIVECPCLYPLIVPLSTRAPSYFSTLSSPSRTRTPSQMRPQSPLAASFVRLLPRWREPNTQLASLRHWRAL
ncbi:hypothetical protein FIBSPDRAFT_591435 [Athelia psychrophila]|uniref:Uncharacterized protein n=1 Tax=Athelia psychrophila TaxID=1759441 RepID=A0A166H2Q8_9AGAM|nr:hypothetical protein FIBSPDRAFT_591435 [Fibularhizoctonia sp. CBS 109695]